MFNIIFYSFVPTPFPSPCNVQTRVAKHRTMDKINSNNSEMQDYLQ